MAISVLQNFRANAQRTLDELRAKNADPALIEAARKAFAEAGESLQSAEHEAHAFAASFLMPEDDVLSIIPFVASLNQLVKAKKRWGVSVSALAYRLHKMGLLTDWQYRMFCIQINRKYEQSEPNRLPPERSRVWQMVLRELTG
jgi:Zn-dependent peptidase ImmA (M78 family)